MKQAALILFFLLLPCFNSHADEPPEVAPTSPRPEAASLDSTAAPENRALPLEQPALWIPGVRSRAGAGTLPSSPDTDRGRLLFAETGLHYTERIGSRDSELLAIPYTSMVSVSAELSDDGTALLFVTEAGGPAENTRPHLFVIMPAGPVEAGAFATQARELIESRIPAKTRVADGVVREEKVAVSAAEWPPTIVFGDPEPLPPAGNPDRLGESVEAGAKVGAVPFVVCANMGCPPPAILPGLALMAIGAAVGAIVGAGREIAANFQKVPPQLPGFSPGELQATSSVLVTAVIESLGQSAFQACMMGKLASGGETKEPLQWKDDGRVATLSLAADGSRDGHHYAVETFLSNVVLVPAGTHGQESGDMSARLVVKAGLRFHDLNSGTSRELSTAWRAEPRTLREWADNDGALLRETLGKGCDALADDLLSEARRAWEHL